MNGKSGLDKRDVLKRFLAIFIPMAAIAGAVAFYIYHLDVKGEKALLSVQEKNNVEFKARTVSENVSNAIGDLIYISRSKDLREMPERWDMPRSIIEGWRSSLAGEFLGFSSAMGLYEEIRYLDESGMEVVNVKSRNGKAFIVPDRELRNRSDTACFKGAFSLDREMVYASPLDLMADGGKVEDPATPVIRFSTPVFDRRGRKRGIVIVNYFGKKIIEDLKKSSLVAPGEVMLLNAEGYWLSGPNPADEWAFMYPDKKDRTFAKEYPIAWERVSREESGQIETPKGIFTFTTVYPLREAENAVRGISGGGTPPARGYGLKVVSFVSRSAMKEKTGAYSATVFRLYAVLLAAMAASALYMSVLNARRRLAEEELKEKGLALERSNAELKDLNASLEFEVKMRKRADDAVIKTVDDLERANSELARSNADLEQFAYVASHDLQEPLRIVAGYAQLLARRYRGRFDTDADEYIGYVVDGTKRMQVLISDLLTFSRAGKHKELKPVSLNEVYGRVTANLKLIIAEAQATITRGDLPTVMADPVQMTQLLQNLIGNAVKYRGEDHPAVHVQAERRNGEWLISVTDNGIGIDPKYFDRIFVLFQRLHGKGEYSGTGIGLSICKKIVENHGGRIWVESAPGRGATFYFTMPSADYQEKI